MTDEIDLEADVARLREKWFGAGSTPPRALDAEEEAVAAKWMGTDAARKLANTRTGQRYRPPVVTARYGYIPRTKFDGISGDHRAFGDYWYVEVTSDGQMHSLFEGERSGCLKAIARLERMKVPVLRIGSERSPEELAPAVRSRPKPSARLAMLQQLAGFRA